MEICIRLSDSSHWIAGKLYGTNATALQRIVSKFPPMSHQPKSEHLTAPSVLKIDFNERSHAEAPETQQQPAFEDDGPLEYQAVLCLHGWLDNAASYDILIPEILNAVPKSKHVVVLAIDFVGHGLSSHLPPRSEYSMSVYLRDVYDVLNGLGWKENLLLIGHSMGGAVSCILASMFPEMIKELVLIENLGPFSYLEEDFSKKLKTHIVQTHRLLSKSMPEYETVEQAEQARQRGTAKGTLSKRGAYLLVSRGLVDAKTKSIGPWQTDLKQIWTWRTDQKLVAPTSSILSENQVLSVLQKIRCPALLVLGDRGYGFDESDKDFPWIDSSKRFNSFRSIQKRIYPGGHHLHLDALTSKKIASDIADLVSSGNPKSRL